jgi:hypothetical protein
MVDFRSSGVVITGKDVREAADLTPDPATEYMKLGHQSQKPN